MDEANVPLCVELDGALTPVDTMHESILQMLRHAPALLLAMPLWRARGKAVFNAEVGKRAWISAVSLPYRADVLAWIGAARILGRRVILVAGADRQLAEAVAAHLGVFDEVISVDEGRHRSNEAKRLALVARFGERGFDYVSGRDNAVVWPAAREVTVIGSKASIATARRVTTVAATSPQPRLLTPAWLRAMRLHQWVKNALVFLPALLAHQILKPQILLTSVLAFIAFGLCASSVYFVNDLMDLPSDRDHPRKRLRPFAAGVLSAKSGLIGAALLFAGAAIMATHLNWKFGAVLGGYYVLTWAYSLRLKRAALVDVMTLAGLYTIRIIAGAAATGIPLSFWLLAFSVFMFLSLGIVKRYAELDDLRKAGNEHSHGRGYSASDLALLTALGIASGYSAIIVIAFYINSAESQVLYHHSKPMWLICPLMLYWISRIWLLTTRGFMHDDPVVFALRDRVSLGVLGAMAAIVVLSI
jgi:4-hydroxybenzoate polyprenyltransferase